MYNIYVKAGIGPQIINYADKDLRFKKLLRTMFTYQSISGFFRVITLSGDLCTHCICVCIVYYTVLLMKTWVATFLWFPSFTEKEFPPHDVIKADTGKTAASKSKDAGTREPDGSSAESGDSEIELVSEEPPKPTSNPFAQPPKGKDAFSQSNNPFDNLPVLKGGIGSAGNHAPPTAYSILREEREAELDSDLFIESASEESPKREQGFSGPKQGVSPPSPLLSSIVPPRSTAETLPAEPLITENVKTPVKTEEDRPSKPNLPTATVPPEVRLEKPHTDDMQQHTTEVEGDLEKPAEMMFLGGMNKQKGWF